MIICLIQVLPFILFSGLKVPLPNIKCLSLSFLLHEVFNYQGWNTDRTLSLPDTSVRRLHHAETFSFILLCIPSPYLHQKPLLLLHFLQHMLFHPYKECSAQSQRQLCRGEGCWEPLRTSWSSLPPLRSWFYLGGKKIKGKISQHHIHTTWNLHMQSSNGQLMCDFHFSPYWGYFLFSYSSSDEVKYGMATEILKFQIFVTKGDTGFCCVSQYWT